MKAQYYIDLTAANEHITALEAKVAGLEMTVAIIKGAWFHAVKDEQFGIIELDGAYASNIYNALSSVPVPLAVVEGRYFNDNKEPEESGIKTLLWFEQFTGDEKQEMPRVDGGE